MRARSNRSPKRGGAGALAVVVSGALLLGACGGDDGDAISVERQPGTEATSEPTEGRSAAALFAASEQTAEATSGRMRLSVEMSGRQGGQALEGTIVADGRFDDANRRYAMEMEMGDFVAQLAGSSGESLPPGMEDMRLLQVVDGATMYMRFDGVALPGLPTGWISMDVAQLAEGPGNPLESLGSPVGGVTSPNGFLAAIEEAGATVDEIADDRIDGEDATRYEGTIDPRVAVEEATAEDRAELESLLSQAGLDDPIPFTAWVDDDGVLRRMEMSMSVREDGAELDMVIAMELFDLGEPVDIEVPPASEVTPFGPQGLGQGPQAGAA